MPRTHADPIAANAAETCVDVAARFLAEQSGALDRILTEHRPGPDGRCTGCRTRPVPWPCSLAAIAQIAREPRPVSGGTE